jgi:predicted P-loop ATPase
VDIEEVEATGQRELSELKSLITSTTIKERRPYARFRGAKHRLASFCATGNQQRFLTDDTGNRRWLCFKVKSIDDPRAWAIDYQQLYAQLRDEFYSGFLYWFDYEDEQRVECINQPFRVESDEEQLIRMRLRLPHGIEPVKLMNAAMVCQLLNVGHVGYPLSSRKVSVAMKRLGFESVHCMSGNFYRVFEVPYDQIQSRLASDAYESEHEASQEPDLPTQSSIPF